VNSEKSSTKLNDLGLGLLEAGAEPLGSVLRVNSTIQNNWVAYAPKALR
jgi:hypothetical protein